MRLHRLQSMGTHGISYDTETHLVQPGLVTPPVVVGSAGWFDEAAMKIQGELLTKEQALEMFAIIADNPDKILVGANIAFDIAVVAVEFAKRGIDIMPEICRMLLGDKGYEPTNADGRVFDLQHAEALNAIAYGYLNKDPRNGGPLVNPETGKRGRYSLATCVDLTLGRKDAKANDEWRMRYAELEGIPLDQWPQSAKDYPIDDAKNTIECALAQAGILPKTTPHHTWGPKGACVDCGATSFGVQCLTKRPHLNLHDLQAQTGTAVMLHMGASWGFRVDQKYVDIIEDYSRKNREEGQKPFIDAGIVRANGSEDRSELKRRIAVAHGSSEPCPVCEGTGKVPSPKNPKSKIICFKLDEYGNKKKTCDGTGLVLNPDVPRSEKDGIAYGRDVLAESGDETLMNYSSYLEDQKTLNVYVPYLRTARVCTDCGKHGTEDSPHVDGCAMSGWKDIPLILRPNPILDTGRVSYDGTIQLMPRKPGFVDKSTGIYIPSLRECIMARDGWGFSSEDFKAGELYTHAQSCIWTVGHSDLAVALLNNVDPHSKLAASVLGVTYDEFIKHKKEPKFKNARQAAKPFTFGKPGGMGTVKLVHQQRAQGPDTPCEGGPMMVDDGSGNKVPGYKGLRFCILMRGTTSCGSRKVTVWGRREQQISPTCVDCLECADYLGDLWLKEWSENRPYFNFVSNCVDNGMVITPEALVRWPWLQEVYRPYQELEPGQIMQHWSGRLRGGLDFCALANGFFQGLLADISKLAYRIVSRECYDKTVKVPTLLFPNSKPSVYAGGPSPLYGSRPVGFFHDELFAEHPLSMLHDGATRISEVMRDCMRFVCPDVAETADAEPTVMERWYKMAECTRDENGKLIPWRPKHLRPENQGVQT